MAIAPRETVSRLRYCEFVPPMPARDALHLRGLPPSWEESIPESAVDGLKKRAETLAVALARRGRKCDADDLGRRVALLERADELHRHAADIETIVGLYRALAVFAHEVLEPASVADTAVVWAQSGSEHAPAHGPAFRETAGLRNRAYRAVLAAVAQLTSP
jgi:hypothetical protein